MLEVPAHLEEEDLVLAVLVHLEAGDIAQVLLVEEAL